MPLPSKRAGGSAGEGLDYSANEVAADHPQDQRELTRENQEDHGGQHRAGDGTVAEAQQQ